MSKEYDELIDAGFTEEEAEAFESIPFDTPYFAAMIEERRADFETAKEQGISRDEFIQSIQEKYDSEEWKNPFAMLRTYEDEYRDKNPEYESPWEKRQRQKRKEARAKYREQRGEQKYPRGATYR
jgi:hypothetical protein